MDFLKKIPNGDPLGRQGVESLRVCMLRLYVPGFQTEVIKHGKFVSERSKNWKNRRRTKKNVFAAESA